MSETPNMITPTKQAKNNKVLIIAVVALAMIATIFATLFFTAKINNSATSENPTKSNSQQHESEKKQNNATSDSQKASEELSPEAKAAISAEHRRDPKDPMAKGKVDAPVVIEVYVDFRCTHCAKYSLETEPQLAERIKKGEIRYEFNSLPVLGDESILAAHAAQAAANQGKFWEYHDELFKLTAAGKAKYDDEVFTTIAQRVGISDLKKFTADLKSKETAKTVQNNALRAQKLGINGTPAFLIGYSYVPGAVGIDTMNLIIDQELNRKK